MSFLSRSLRSTFFPSNHTSTPSLPTRAMLHPLENTQIFDRHLNEYIHTLDFRVLAEIIKFFQHANKMRNTPLLYLYFRRLLDPQFFGVSEKKQAQIHLIWTFFQLIDDQHLVPLLTKANPQIENHPLTYVFCADEATILGLYMDKVAELLEKQFISNEQYTCTLLGEDRSFLKTNPTANTPALTQVYSQKTTQLLTKFLTETPSFGHFLSLLSDLSGIFNPGKEGLSLTMKHLNSYDRAYQHEHTKRYWFMEYLNRADQQGLRMLHHLIVIGNIPLLSTYLKFLHTHSTDKQTQRWITGLTEKNETYLHKIAETGNLNVLDHYINFLVTTLGKNKAYQTLATQACTPNCQGQLPVFMANSIADSHAHPMNDFLSLLKEKNDPSLAIDFLRKYHLDFGYRTDKKATPLFNYSLFMPGSLDNPFVSKNQEAEQKEEDREMLATLGLNFL